MAQREQDAAERVRVELGSRNSMLEDELRAARAEGAEFESKLATARAEAAQSKTALKARAAELEKTLAALRLELARVRIEGQAALRARAAEEERRLADKEQELAAVRLDAADREAALGVHAGNLKLSAMIFGASVTSSWAQARGA